MLFPLLRYPSPDVLRDPNDVRIMVFGDRPVLLLTRRLSDQYHGRPSFVSKADTSLPVLRAEFQIPNLVTSWIPQ